MREKPVRTPVDEEDRLRFAQEHAKKPASYWANSVHAHMDNETFPVCLTAPRRACAAQRAARGARRARAQGLAQGHVKPRKAVKVNYEKSAMVAVALSARKVIMRHSAPGAWNAAEAAHMYQSALSPALARHNPRKRKYLVLEDNDPSGYKSRAAEDAKKAAGTSPMIFPKRSPDMNPLDLRVLVLHQQAFARAGSRLPTVEARDVRGVHQAAEADHPSRSSFCPRPPGKLH